MIDIYCGDRVCPICRGKMFVRKYVDSDNIDVSCPNKCYSIVYMGEKNQQAFISIFGDFIVFDDKDFKTLKTLVELVCYWRKDERYLTKIMGV